MRLYLIYFTVSIVLLQVLTARSFDTRDNFESPLLRIKRFDQEPNIFLEQDPDFNRDVTELITSKGYQCENHEVETADGFILSFQRIPPKSNTTNPPVVYLQHGLLDTSATWVLNFPNQSLGFLLADAGFDVWLGNIRGSYYTRRHKKLQPTEKEFWDWSWDEMAKYDIPAMLEYISSKTGSQIHYIGHSQGTTVAFAAFSSYPQTAKLIKKYIALAPIATLGGIFGIFKEISDFVKIPEQLFNILGVYEILPSINFTKTIIGLFCGNKLTIQACETLVLMLGLDPKNANMTRLPVYAAHFPAGTSVKNLVHYIQIVRSNCFQKFDYGIPENNLEHYNQTTNPQYNARDVTVPTYLFYGGKDELSDLQDVESLMQLLPNVVMAKNIPQYQHMDFVWGMDAPRVVYQEIIQIIRVSAN